MHGSALGCMLYTSRRQSVSGVSDRVYWRIVVVVSKYSDFYRQHRFLHMLLQGGGVFLVWLLLCALRI